MTIMTDRKLPDFNIPSDLAEILLACQGYAVAGSVDELVELSTRDAVNGWQEVAYDVPGQGPVVEARVCRVKNGVAANYLEPYMRRRDPDCMVIGDDRPTNKPRYIDRFGQPFSELRTETFNWFKGQELSVFPFIAGVGDAGLDAVAVVPANAGFFALGLALLQGLLTPKDLAADFDPKAIIYVAPPFRHTRFDGKQVVVHHRRSKLHELFSYNLYPGPSAKKGIYGVLISLGEKEDWITAHCSTVQVVTPYDNKVTIMHEGASGGGKSEMLEHAHRELDGRLKLGTNLVTGEKRLLTIPRTCELRPVTDDMALCHPSLQKDNGLLGLKDAEDSWFVRVNHITEYGTDPHLERLTIHAPRPLMYLNIEATPGATSLIWEHVQDSPGKPCPNPRVVLPREIVPGIVHGAVSIQIRSFGVRTPPCTKTKPTYGIIGLFHVLPPALAWLWRLVAPRGYNNPSITDSEALSSEGVGSYWPFATGRLVDQANLLLYQIRQTPRTQYILIPNQHIGAWRVGFMPQWLTREFLARRGSARFSTSDIEPARCGLLGYSIKSVVIEGTPIPTSMLCVDQQTDVGPEAYDRGAEILKNFFHNELKKYLDPDLEPLGKQIIECCLDNGPVENYLDMLPGSEMMTDDNE